MPRLLASSTPVSEGQYAGALIKGGRQVWPYVPPPAYFTGGIVTDVGQHRYHTFTSSGTLTLVNTGPVSVEYLVVAGGGAGGLWMDGNANGGGGGAGGALVGAVALAATQTVTVGAGGAAGVSNFTAGGDGSGSSLGSISTVGGGGGGAGVGRPGGSGGGGGGQGAIAGGAGTAGQGNAGGSITKTYLGGGGGGGKTAVGGDTTGVNGNDGKGGVGGAGIEWPTGSGRFYAGGGGGESISGLTAAGGVGGGGNGGAFGTGGVSSPAKPGTPNTGGGGGGFGIAAEAPAGGSGKVIVRYLKAAGMPDIDLTPTEIPGLMAWYDASDTATITATSGKAMSVADKSGNGWTVTPYQGNAGLAPTTGTATINGKNVLTYNGSNYLSSTPLPSFSHPTTYVAVGRRTDNAVGYGMLAGISNEGPAVFGSFISFVAPDNQMNDGPVDAKPHVFFAQIYRDLGTYNGLFIDGTLKVTRPSPPTTRSNCQIQLGGDYGSWVGEFGEAVIYNRILTADERERLTAHLLAKWGIAP